MRVQRLRGALRAGGRLKPLIEASRVLVPIVAPQMSAGRAVLKILGTVEADAGTISGKYLSASGAFVDDPALATNIRGLPGPESTTPGPQGNTGWTPILAGEADGTRTLVKVADWTGGQGEKPPIGMYLGTAGYVTAKADAFNFNAAKRVEVMSAPTNAQGVATIDYSATGFAKAPVVRALPATTAVLSGPTQSTVGTTTKTSTTVTVRQQALLTGVLSLLAGATANVLVIEQ